MTKKQNIKRQKSEKNQPWTRKDVVSNVAVFIINIFITTGLFLVSVYLNNLQTGQPFFSDIRPLIYFIMVVALVFSLMAICFYFDDRDFFKHASNTEMIFLIIQLSLIICYVIGRYADLYLRPLALAGLLTLFLSSRKNALLVNMVFSILMLVFDIFGSAEQLQTDYLLLIVSFASGMIGIFVMMKVYSRIKLLLRSFAMSIPVMVLILIRLIDGVEVSLLKIILSGIASGPLVVVCFVMLLPVLEWIFNKVTCFKFAELTDHKSQLIKKLIEQAPGTFNHSIVVSNIAEACATAIGEDSLLARTCAYYHDIGKLRRPEFFKENQTDNVNPHDDLTPELSTNIIKAHASDGYNLIMKNRLPKVIADVCLEHHGTLPILYFYDKAKKFTDGEVDIDKFRYNGPKPSSKIAAIIMIADSCEAATRTLIDRSTENVKKVVRSIVSEKMQLGQFDDCEITIKELNIIMNIVINTFTGVYHSRIEYPKVSLEGIELKEEEADE